jgi:hypothetical protein
LPRRHCREADSLLIGVTMHWEDELVKGSAHYSFLTR